MTNISVQDIMETQVVAVRPDMLLAQAAKILGDHKFDGVPVVDEHNILIGILTEYDLVSKGSAMHLPTFQKILANLHVLGKDKAGFQSDIAEVANMKVRDVMNTDPLTLHHNATYEEAVAAFRDHHRVNPIPIIDDNRKVIGVISRFDILKPLQALIPP